MPFGSDTIQGVIVAVAGNILDIRQGTGPERRIGLVDSASIVRAHGVPRSGLSVDRPIAVAANQVANGDAVLLIGYACMEAGRSASSDDLARKFLPAPHSDSAHPGWNDSVIVAGRLVNFDEQTLTILQAGLPVKLKLTPETICFEIEPGERSDLRSGVRVFVPLGRSGAESVLVYR